MVIVLPDLLLPRKPKVSPLPMSEGPITGDRLVIEVHSETVDVEKCFAQGIFPRKCNQVCQISFRSEIAAIDVQFST